MKRDIPSFAGPGRSSIPPDLYAAPSQAPSPPPWWLGNRAQYRSVHDARREIHEHDRMMAKKALAMMMGSVLTAVLIYSVDAAGASADPAGSGFMITATVFLLVLTALWMLDRRLAQQFRDARLQALVWSDLVAAVRQGWVDLALIETGAPFETVVEELLRRELLVVVQYLKAQEGFELHLPVFNEGITLTQA